MKKVSFVFVTLILGFLLFQNAYSVRFETLEWADPLTRRLVLWKIRTQSLESDGRMYITVDSVLLQSSMKNEIFSMMSFYISSGTIKMYANILKPNTSYLVLAIAGCDEMEARAGKCFLVFPAYNCLDGKEKGDCILPDTPKNKEYLIKRFNENKVTHKYWHRSPKGRDIDI